MAEEPYEEALGRRAAKERPASSVTARAFAPTSARTHGLSEDAKARVHEAAATQHRRSSPCHACQRCRLHAAYATPIARTTSQHRESRLERRSRCERAKHRIERITLSIFLDLTGIVRTHVETLALPHAS